MMQMDKKKLLILKELLSHAFMVILFIFAGAACFFNMLNTKLDLTILGLFFIIPSIIVLLLISQTTLALMHDGQFLYKKNLFRSAKICKLSEIEIVNLSNNNEIVVLGNLSTKRTVLPIYQIKTPKVCFFIHEEKYNNIANFINSIRNGVGEQRVPDDDKD